MVDIVDKGTRSRMMAGIKGSNTKPERDLRAALHGRGFRYRIHAKNMAGRPDLVFPKYHAVVFVHGCFWHRHEGCRYATTPATKPEFWRAKFESNAARDQRVEAVLLAAGWRVATVWECALKRRPQLEGAADQLVTWLRSDVAAIQIEGVGLTSDGDSPNVCFP